MRKGTHHTESAKEKLRQLYLGKTYEELHGEKKAKEIKEIISRKNKEAYVRGDFKDRWKDNPHPRGMLGKKQSEEIIEKRRIGAKKFWNNPLNKERIMERNKKLSQSRTGKGLGNTAWNKGKGIRKTNKIPMKRIKNKSYYVSHINWCRENQIHKVPDGCMIHHIDGNQFNNEPENLQLMTRDFHNKLHSQLMLTC